MKTRFTFPKMLAVGIITFALATAAVSTALAQGTAAIDRASKKAFVLKVLQRADGASASPGSSLPLSTPITVEVAPGSTPSSLTTLTTSASSETAAMDLAPNKVEPGSFVVSLRPVLFIPWLIALQSLSGVALIIVLGVHRRKQRQALDLRHAGERATEAAICEQLAAMDEALAANSAPAFFKAARHVVQERLAQRWNLPISHVTAAEISRRLNGRADDLRTLFTFAEEVVYSGRRVLPEDLKRWKDTVTHHIKRLEDL